MPSRTATIGRKLRTALVVVVITLLIWIAADQWVTTDVPVSITIQPISLSSERYVGLAEPPFHRAIKITLRGRRSRIESFRQKYEAPQGDVIKVALDDLQAPSTQVDTIDVREYILRNVPELRLAGNVVSAEPEKLNIRIDDYVDVNNIPVRFDYGELRVNDQPDTRKVSARMPRFVAENEQFEANRYAVVHATPLITNATPGQKFEFAAKPMLELPIELPPDAVQFSPTTIKVSGQIETLEVQEQKGPITVKWSVPDNVQREYVIVPESESELVALYRYVKGPTERVAQLDASKIRAFVEVMAADVTGPELGKTIVRDVVFLLPPDFSDCKLVETSESRQVKFHLERRGPAKGTTDETETAGE